MPMSRAYKEPRALYRVCVCPGCSCDLKPNPLSFITGLKYECTICGRITNNPKIITRREDD